MRCRCREPVGLDPAGRRNCPHRPSRLARRRVEKRSIDDADTVRRHLALDHPEFEPGELQLAADKRSALILDRGERRSAVLFALGDRVTVRIVAPGDLAGVAARGGDLVLTLTDLGARRLILRLGDAEAAQAWAARLEGLMIRSTETQGGRSAAVLAL